MELYGPLAKAQDAAMQTMAEAEEAEEAEEAAVKVSSAFLLLFKLRIPFVSQFRSPRRSRGRLGCRRSTFSGTRRDFYSDHFLLLSDWFLIPSMNLVAYQKSSFWYEARSLRRSGCRRSASFVYSPLSD